MLRRFCFYWDVAKLLCLRIDYNRRPQPQIVFFMAAKRFRLTYLNENITHLVKIVFREEQKWSLCLKCHTMAKWLHFMFRLADFHFWFQDDSSTSGHAYYVYKDPLSNDCDHTGGYYNPTNVSTTLLTIYDNQAWIMIMISAHDLPHGLLLETQLNEIEFFLNESFDAFNHFAKFQTNFTYDLFYVHFWLPRTDNGHGFRLLCAVIQWCCAVAVIVSHTAY